METVVPRKVRKLASVVQEKDNQIQALESTNEKNQHKTLRLNEEIDDHIKNRYVARRGFLTTCYVSSKRIADRFTHITLFVVNIDSFKKISDGLNFVTQTWGWMTNAMIQMSFIDGTGLSMK